MIFALCEIRTGIAWFSPGWRVVALDGGRGMPPVDLI
jgi:hypothetical protein